LTKGAFLCYNSTSGINSQKQKKKVTSGIQTEVKQMMLLDNFELEKELELLHSKERLRLI